MKAIYRYKYFDSTHRFHKIVGNSVLEVHIIGDIGEKEDDICEAHIVSTSSGVPDAILKRNVSNAKDFKMGYKKAQKYLNSLC